ncbi:hypothetical protein [Spiroplasma endosymbiont of Dactylopius coccus]
MPWYGYLLLGILLLIILYPFLITRKNIKILQRVGSYIISAPPRTGKSALACCLAQKHKGRVVSPIPIKVRNEYSYRCSYDDVFKFNQLNSNYAFKENDMLVFDELGLKINSNDLSPEFKETQESLGMFCKLIGHNFNGIMYMIEQHPDRIPKQAREKVEYIVQVKRMRILLFLVKFKLNIYTNVDDYNKVVLSKRQTKRIIKRGGLPPSYSGETMTFSLWFPRSYLQRYNSRALNYIHSLKSELSTVKDYEQSQALDFTVDDIRAVGLDKLDNILQTEKKETENTVCRTCYYRNKHSNKNKKNFKIE